LYVQGVVAACRYIDVRLPDLDSTAVGRGVVSCGTGPQFLGLF